MAGYCGYSMSNNAVKAYNEGEKPLSKWSKKDIIEAVVVREKTSIDISVLTLKELRDEFLVYSSWHHTSKFYNQTEFYNLDEVAIERFNEEKLNKIVNSRVKKVKRSKEEIEKKKIEKELNKAKKEYKKVCKQYSQNECFIGQKMIAICTIEEINGRIELLKKLSSEYSRIWKTCKYKTVRGYINNELKGMGEK